MKLDAWTCTLVAAGIVSLPSAATSEEKPSSLLTSVSSTTLSGYVDTSAQWNFGTGNQNNPLYAFGGNTKADGFNLNVVKLTLEKPTDPAEGWAAGYKVDLLFGPDADALGTQSVLSSGTSDFAVKQAYVSLRAPVGNGVDFKLGVWDTIIGYEVTESPRNPNFTRSYGYTIEPPTHTGLQAAYSVNDVLALTTGVANTFGPPINQRAFLPDNKPGVQAESYKTYLGAVTLTAPKEWGWVGGSTLSGVIINGFNASSPATRNSGSHADQTSYYVGATFNTPLEALKVGIAYDYAGVGDQPQFGVVGGYAEAVGFYACYRVTEKFSLNGRSEYFFQTPGNAIGGLPSKVVATTLTGQYDLWKNVLSRIEFRWDHQADGLSDAYGAPPSSPGPPGSLGGSRRNAYELIANVVYSF